MGFDIILYSVRWPSAAFGAEIQIQDFFLVHITTNEKKTKQKWKWL